jgi:hypothetical protein
MAVGQELPIDVNASAFQMAQTIFGSGATVLSASYSGDRLSSGIYSNANAVTPGVAPADSGVILSTGYVRDFTQSSGDPNRSGSTSTNTTGQNDNPMFNALVGGRTFDAAILTTNFIPTGDVLTISFVFASEEYPEFAGSIYNDAVGIWINGQIVTSPVVNFTQINSINQSANSTLFVNNTGDAYNTEMDGFTVTLSLLIPVNPGVVNTLTIGIADVADASYDSAVLIAAGSVQNAFIAQDDTLTLGYNQPGFLDVLANDGNGVGAAVVTHINGIAVSVGSIVTLSDGALVVLMPDSTLFIMPPVQQAGQTAPVTTNFSYTAQSTAGVSDTAFVTVTAVPCFTPGTRIRTLRGEVPVEALAVGDMVETRDHGPQPIRWIGQRRVAAVGAQAPVVIEAGLLGLHGRLVVSPQHRVLVSHWMAELLFCEEEVLVAARDLVNGASVRVLEGGEVTYVHLLFDRHEIIWAEGLQTESFLPGPQVLADMDPAARAELLRLFPEIDARTHLGYGPAARTTLRRHEAELLKAVSVA